MRSASVVVVVGASVALFLACGSSTSDQTNSSQAGGNGGTTSGGTGGTTSGGGMGGIPLTGGGGMGGIPLSGGAAGTSPVDASDGAVVTDAGWFDCNSCSCDGTSHYCVVVSGGAANPPPPPADAAICADDAGTGSYGCVPLPAGCDPPACDCISMPFGGACTCSDAGGGILVQCFLP
jgi:hypothetical protein